MAGTGSPYYRSTYVRSSSYGARLTRTGVVAKRIALLATTCRTCGTVKVYWGSTLLKTVSLYSATTVNKKVIPIKTFTTARSGTLKIKVVSSGKKGHHRRCGGPAELRPTLRHADSAPDRD